MKVYGGYPDEENVLDIQTDVRSVAVVRRVVVAGSLPPFAQFLASLLVRVGRQGCVVES